jgi:Lon protease-like protein
MFPLGTVLLPGGVLPLHVFEPRYRALVRDCLAGSPVFGVVLIERGSEVGGGDVRTNLGTLARILEVGRFPDGRYALLTVGTERIRVVAWLPDDPYPQAEVVTLEDAAPGPGAEGLREEVARLVRRVVALRSELGEPVPPVVELEADPAAASWQAAVLGGVGPLDAQRLLGVDDPTERLALVAGLLADIAAVCEFRLRGGGRAE